MDIGYLESHVRFSMEEKTNCMEIVNEMLRLQDISIKYGLLALEEEIRCKDKWKNYPLLVKGIELITDGTDPKYVEKIMKNYIISDGSTGDVFLKSMIILAGILGLQEGLHPWLLKELLKSYFGTEFSELFDGKCIYKDDKMFSENRNSDKNDVNKASYSEKTELLEHYLKVDARSIQRLLREVDIMLLANALYGASGKTVAYFMQNLSVRTENLIMNLIHEIHPTEGEMISSQKAVNEISVQLEAQGEIILS